jgi:redox-sensitive bicupin YhaK (pirin superfamily)
MLLVEPREIKLTTRSEIAVRRTVPHAKLRRVGAWVFLDHFGPTPQVDGMTVAAHPHTGLQTVTWLFEGQVHHRDSVGSSQLIRPGQLNLMTAGTGVAHSEKARVASEVSNLHAVQLWVALPKSASNQPASFEHLNELPQFEAPNLTGTVFIGEFGGAASPAKVYSPLMAAQLDLSGGTSIDLRPDWEYAILPVAGGVIATSADGETLEAAETELVYLPMGTDKLRLEPTGAQSAQGTQGATLLLIGGEPFDEEIIMWWNFIERTPEAIAVKREQWNARETHPVEGFEIFEDEIGGWIPAPELPNVTLRARGRN